MAKKKTTKKAKVDAVYVRLLCGRLTDGGPQRKGAVVQVSADEGARMVEKRQAELVDGGEWENR